MFAKEEGPVDKEHHMLYTVTGEGKGMVFQNGDVIDATWKKKTATDRITFYNDEGDEIPFVRGKTWIEVLPLGNEVSY